MRVFCMMILCLAAVVLAGFADPQAAPAGPSLSGRPPADALRQCIGVMERAIDHAEAGLPEMSRAAESAAARWMAGGDLYAAGDPSFTDEAFYRAGGVIGLRRIGPCKRNKNGLQVQWDEVPEQSVILYGMHRNADPGLLLFDDLGHLMFERDTVVFFGSSAWMACRRSVEGLKRRLSPERFFFLDTGLPLDSSLATAAGRRYGDTAGMVTTIHLWAYTAELMAACTRRGKVPAIWPSGAIPGYEEWEAKYADTRFHDDITVRPIEAGVLGRKFLGNLRRQIRACETVAPQVCAAAKMLAEVPADRAVYVMVDSHLLSGDTWLPKELTNWILVQRSWRWRRAALTVEKGDGVFWLGSFDWPAGQIEKAAKQGNPFAVVSLYGPGREPRHVRLVTPGVPSPEPATDPGKSAKAGEEPLATGGDVVPPGVVWIPAPWQYPDAVVEIEGYPLPAIPTSSIIQGTLLWGVIGEVMSCR